MRALLDTASRLLIPLVLLGLSTALGRLLARPLGLIRLQGLLGGLSLYSLCGCIAFSWIGTVLAVLGVFRWWLLLTILSCIAVLALRHAQRITLCRCSFARSEHTPISVRLAVVCLVVGIGWLFSRPAESFFVFNDAAVYTIGGVVLSRTGALLYRPEAFWTVSGDFLRQFFFTDLFGTFSRHYGPFYQWTPWNHTLEIGFLPLPKVWMALTTWLFGPQNATWAMPFLGVLSSVLLYKLAEQLLGWSVGLGTMMLLSVSLPQIWFARYPTSEIPTQAFVLGGLYLLLLARRNASRPALSRRLAVWSALALASLTILRFEAVLLLVLLAGLLIVGWVREFSRLPGFAHTWLVVLIIASGIGTALSMGAARYYLFTRALEITPALTRLSLLILLLGAVLVGVGWRCRRQLSCMRIRTQVRQAITRHAPLGIAGGWLIWCAAATWQIINRDMGNSLPGWLAQYWTLPGLAVSLVGVLWLLWRDRQETVSAELLALLGLSVILMVGFSIRTYVFPIQPWAVRRLMPIVMPTLALTIASTLTLANAVPSLDHAFLPRGSLRGLAIGLSALVITALAGFVGRRSFPVVFHRERAGLWQQLERTAGAFPGDAVLLFDNGNASQGLTQVMELVFGRTSLVIQQSPPRETGSELDRVIQSALEQDRPVYLIVTNGDLAWWPDQWTFVESGMFEIQVPVLRQPEGRRPAAKDVVTQTLWLDTYQIRSNVKSSGSSEESKAIEVPAAGAGSYLYLRDGFHSWYRDTKGRLTRWTEGQATIMLPWPASEQEEAADFCLRLDIAGGRPAGEGAAYVTVMVENRELFKAELPKSFSPQSLDVPVTSITNENDPQLEIQLISTTWDAPAVGDERVLGVLFYGMELMPIDQCESS